MASRGHVDLMERARNEGRRYILSFDSPPEESQDVRLLIREMEWILANKHVVFESAIKDAGRLIPVLLRNCAIFQYVFARVQPEEELKSDAIKITGNILKEHWQSHGNVDYAKGCSPSSVTRALKAIEGGRFALPMYIALAHKCEYFQFYPNFNERLKLKRPSSVTFLVDFNRFIFAKHKELSHCVFFSLFSF